MKNVELEKRELGQLGKLLILWAAGAVWLFGCDPHLASPGVGASDGHCNMPVKIVAMKTQGKTVLTAAAHHKTFRGAEVAFREK